MVMLALPSYVPPAETVHCKSMSLHGVHQDYHNIDSTPDVDINGEITVSDLEAFGIIASKKRKKDEMSLVQSNEIHCNETNELHEELEQLHRINHTIQLRSKLMKAPSDHSDEDCKRPSKKILTGSPKHDSKQHSILERVVKKESSSGSSSKMDRQDQVKECSDTGRNGPSLHEACQESNIKADTIRTILFHNPNAARKKTITKTDQNKSGWRSYPLHTALQHNPSLEAVMVLVSAAPEVLLETNVTFNCNSTGGRGAGRGSCPLSVALAHCASPEVIKFLLLANSNSAKLPDQRLNYPLHVACIRGCSKDVISLITAANPGALYEKNFNGDTPLDILQRSGLFFDDEIINELQQTAFSNIDRETADCLF